MEAEVPILHAGGSGYWLLDVDPETTASFGSTLNDQACGHLLMRSNYNKERKVRTHL